MSKGEIRKSASPKRPQSTPVHMRRGNTMDSQNLIGKTLKVQDWLNEKTVKGLQVWCIEYIIDFRIILLRSVYVFLIELNLNFIQYLLGRKYDFEYFV